MSALQGLARHQNPYRSTPGPSKAHELTHKTHEFPSEGTPDNWEGWQVTYET